MQAQIGLNVVLPFLAKHSETKIAYEQAELQRRRLYRSPDELVMFGGQPLKCAPAHPLRLATVAVEDAWFPA
jgi:hypothetical protein